MTPRYHWAITIQIYIEAYLHRTESSLLKSWSPGRLGPVFKEIMCAFIGKIFSRTIRLETLFTWKFSNIM
jgi:hypothetical protein